MAKLEPIVYTDEELAILRRHPKLICPRVLWQTLEHREELHRQEIINLNSRIIELERIAYRNERPTIVGYDEWEGESDD